MQVDGSVIMWVFGIAFSALTLLVGAIWAMLIWRLKNIETTAKEDRQEFFRILSEEKKDTHESFKKIWSVLDSMRQDYHTIAVSMERQRTDDYREFVTRQECRERHDTGRQIVRPETAGG